MADYTIIPRSDGKFDIGIVGRDGTRQTMLGFDTEADAIEWIKQDKRLTIDAEWCDKRGDL